MLTLLVPDMRGTGIHVLLADNTGAIDVAKNPHGSARSRHIDIRFHIWGEVASDGRIAVEYIEPCRSDDEGLAAQIIRARCSFILNRG